MTTNPRPWSLIDPMKRIDPHQEGWLIVDALGEPVAVLFHGNYESDKAAAELIVRLVNAGDALRAMEASRNIERNIKNIALKRIKKLESKR